MGPLSKMIPLAEDLRGGGVHGGLSEPADYIYWFEKRIVEIDMYYICYLDV